MRFAYNSLANFLQKHFKIDAHYFIKGGFWLSLTQVITITGGLLTSVLFAHYLTPNDFGVYRYVLGLATLFSAFSLTGLGQSILQTAAKGYYTFYNETIKINLYYGLGISLIGLAGALYYWINQNIVLASSCLIIAILQPIINSFQFTPTYLQGSGRFQEAAVIQGIKTLLISLTTIASIFLTDNLIAIVFSYLASNALVSSLSHLYYRPKDTEPLSQAIYQKYLSYAKHTSIRNIISSIASRLDTIIIFNQLGAAQLAVYTIASIIPEQIKGSLKNLTMLIIPKLTGYDKDTLFKNIVIFRSFQLFAILFVITISYVLSAPFVFDVLFPKYGNAVFYSQLLSLVLLTHVFYIPYSVLLVKMEENSLYHLSTWGALFQISLLLGLIPFFGILGAISAKIIYRVVFTVIMYFVVLKKY